jgi:hypothetical protein
MESLRLVHLRSAGSSIGLNERCTSPVLQFIRRIAASREAGELTDGLLLERFARLRDEAAFEALLSRYGPLVFGVCWRVLNHEQDAEDAFQATFLVLARNSASIRQRPALAPWLHGVAYRIFDNEKASAG